LIALGSDGRDAFGAPRFPLGRWNDGRCIAVALPGMPLPMPPPGAGRCIGCGPVGRGDGRII
jgi:hypothetical protein